jgi:hypothetical protein
MSPSVITPFTKMAESYSWDREALRAALERDDPRAKKIATFGNPEPILTINTR